jgi:hypothetical protein
MFSPLDIFAAPSFCVVISPYTNFCSQVICNHVILGGEVLDDVRDNLFWGFLLNCLPNGYKTQNLNENKGVKKQIKS